MSDPGVPIRVLFVCTGNSARSILAEALLRQRGGDRFEVRSAGTAPKGIHPLTLRVLAEAGIDASWARSTSVSEFTDQVDAGEMRWLAVSGETAPDGVDSPTIADSGYDVVLENWRGVMGAPDLSDADRQAVVGLITEMHDSDAWQTALEENGWSDFFKAGDEFSTFLGEEKTRVEGVLADIGLTGG